MIQTHASLAQQVLVGFECQSLKAQSSSGSQFGVGILTERGPQYRRSALRTQRKDWSCLGRLEGHEEGDSI